MEWTQPHNLKRPLKGQDGKLDHPNQGREEKAAPMPTDYGLRLDHGDRIQNRGEQWVEPAQDHSVDVPQPHSRRALAAQHDYLLTQNQVFSLEFRP
jgi:hypothetical protein